MSRKRMVKLAESLSSGVFLDPGDEDIPLWSGGKNVVFDRSGPRPVDGFSPITDTFDTRPIRGVLQVWSENRRLIFYGDVRNLYKYDADADTLERVSKGQNSYNGAFWSFAQWGDWVIATNGVNPVQVYKGGNFADLTTDLQGTLTASKVATHRAHAIFFGTDDEGRELVFSDEDDINTFIPQISNGAGSLFVRDIASPIRAISEHQEGVVFYGDKTAHILRWIQAPLYFGVDLLSKNVGVFGPNSVVQIGGVDFGFGNDGIWMMQPGGQPNYIDTPAIHRTVYGDIDFDNAEKCTAWVDVKQGLVIFSYPSLEDGEGEPTRSVMFTMDTQTWCPLDFAATGASYSPVFQFTSVGDWQGQLYWHGIRGINQPTAFSTLGYIPLTDDVVGENYYGIAGYGELGYGGPAD